MTTLTEARASGLTLFRRGKVRDTFDLGDGTLLMVATDRISAYDVVMPTPIPGKGRILTQMSRWWFDATRGVIDNHLLADSPESLPPAARVPEWGGRTMRVRRADRIDAECVVRGYLAGSGWAEYRGGGTLAGEPLRGGLRESSRLPAPRFTPATKNDSGHDQNISRRQLAEMVGDSMALRLEEASLALYSFAARRCADRGMLLADTKFEFGLRDRRLILIDEVLTPDSSRFWDARTWREGEPQPAFDKQYLRDWLATLDWDRTPPGPEIPAAVVEETRARYVEAARRVCGLEVS